MKNPYSAIYELKIGEITDVKKTLFQALGRLLKAKPYHEINVKALAKESHITRVTFYMNYKNIDELVEDVENYHIIQLMKLNEGLFNKDISAERYYSYYKETINYIESNRDIFYAFLITNVNGRFIEKWKSAIKYQLLERDSSFINKKKMNFILEMAVLEVIDAYTFWLKNPYEEIDVLSLDEIVNSTIKLIDF